MLWAYPGTRKQLVFTLGGLAAGAVLISVGAQLSLANIAPQQARTKAGSDRVRQQLRKWLDRLDD